MKTLNRVTTSIQNVTYTQAGELPYTANSKKGQLVSQKQALESTAKQLQDGIASASKKDVAMPFALASATAVNGYESYVNQTLASTHAQTYIQQARGELKQIALKHEKVISDIAYLTQEAEKLQNTYAMAWGSQFVMSGQLVGESYINSQQTYLNGLDNRFNRLMAETNGVKTNGCLGQ